jgi:hypothetical protein
MSLYIERCRGGRRGVRFGAVINLARESGTVRDDGMVICIGGTFVFSNRH